MSATHYLAVDLGAESGRVIVGTFRGERMTLQEAHRFANVPVRLPDGLHWDVLRLYGEILDGLRAAVRLCGPTIAGIGIDSWAVDYGLLDAGGRLLGNPYHYRDARTDGVNEQIAQHITPAEQYARTGIAQLPFNTLYQLVAQKNSGDAALGLSRSLLMMPDLLHYWLSGVAATEYTNATSTGMLGVDGRWASDWLARLGLADHMLLAPRQPGAPLGALRAAVQAECGLAPTSIILPATHDTACAVVAVPAARQQRESRHAYISSGTWSLLGLELDRPILSEEARLAGFTNEGGVAGTFRFLTNIMGLWLIQECRRAWARAGTTWTYEELTAAAMAAPSPGVIVDASDPSFLHPDDMPAAIAMQLRRTGQRALDEPVELARAIMEGLALSYRLALEQAERLTSSRVDTIHVVGGGARNSLLCQLTADASGRPVLAGPTEATALGNVLVQAMGRGEIGSLAEAHLIARGSADLTIYEPHDGGDWDARAARLRALRDAG